MELDTSLKGLSSGEAKKRVEMYGLNILPKKKKKNIFRILLEEVYNPIEIILLVTLLSFVAK